MEEKFSQSLLNHKFLVQWVGNEIKINYGTYLVQCNEVKLTFMYR
jgi:hypothetical protein